MTDSPVKMIVGLGNPGLKYRRNRHNIGFMVVEEVARRLDLEFSQETSGYICATTSLGEGLLVLLKPLTYMNLSGEALVQWGQRHGQQLSGGPWPADLPDTADLADMDDMADMVDMANEEPPVRPLVICDDLALPLGSIRLRAKGSSGGQNGLASIVEHLEGELFPRLRLGIAPLSQSVDPALWPDYVLSDFAADELETVGELVNTAGEAVDCWLAEGLTAAVSRFNRRIRPPEEV